MMMECTFTFSESIKYKKTTFLSPPSCVSRDVWTKGNLKSRFLIAKLQTNSDIQKFMEKILSFLKKSNRCKHLIGGFLVGLFALSPFPALYAAAVAASCLELKDRLNGCPWDWIDWLLTVAGGCLAALLLLIIWQIHC